MVAYIDDFALMMMIVAAVDPAAAAGAPGARGAAGAVPRRAASLRADRAG